MVKLIKLVTGEEIMGDMEWITEGESLELENPVRLALTQQGLAMVPWTPFIKGNKITISSIKVNAIYIADADDDLANEYRSKFGGITLAHGPIELGK